MQRNVMVALCAGLVVGAAGMWGVLALANDTVPQGSTVSSHDTMSMEDMTNELLILSGEEYDKAFIEMMIAHHEGAVDMARLSETRAAHDEIKQLSNDILVAQNQEISDMQSWQRAWGYEPNEAGDKMHAPQ